MSSPRSRREVLIACSSVLGASLAGCSERGTTAPEPSESSTQTTIPSTETPTGRTEEPVSQTYTNPSVPVSEVSFEWTAELLHRGSSTKPPELRLELTSTTDEVVGLAFGPTPPFSDPLSGTEESENRLVLYHPEMGPHTTPDSRIERCWRLESDPMVAVNAAKSLVELQSGDTVSETYTVYNTPENASCFPDGTYRFIDRGAQLRVEEYVDMTMSLLLETADGRVTTVTAEGPTFPQ